MNRELKVAHVDARIMTEALQRVHADYPANEHNLAAFGERLLFQLMCAA
jgi:hypothetical protein